jgi:methylenetetrahydrofolate dehydrogenase (NAD+)
LLTDEIQNLIKAQSNQRPTLVGFLANEDPFAVKYAEWTGKTCEETGIRFELRKVDREKLEGEIIKANQDDQVNGIIVYYPVFGDRQDQYLQNVVSPSKDVEGLCHKYCYNMYHNIRYLDEEKKKKCIIPCTPLAIIKILEHIGVYNQILPYGDRLHGKTIAVINRSEVVGRPLAALLANDGAKVYSIDINGVQIFSRGPGIELSRHQVTETKHTVDEVLPLCDVVITGVPSASYQVNVDQLKDGVVAINFSSYRNFPESIKEKASIYVPSVGKVTVAMLQRNLLRLAEYQRQ